MKESVGGYLSQMSLSHTFVVTGVSMPNSTAWQSGSGLPGVQIVGLLVRGRKGLIGRPMFVGSRASGGSLWPLEAGGLLGPWTHVRCEIPCWG